MKLLIIAFAVALFALLGAARSSAVTMYACAGTPTDTAYRSAFDGSHGQLLDGNVRYPYKTTLWEHQTWLTPAYETPGHHSEHLHLAACLPQGETLTSGNGADFFDVAVTAHNVTGYTATNLSGAYVTQNGSSQAFQATAAQLEQINAAMQASGNVGTQRIFLTMPAQAVGSNGLKEVRWGMTVVRKDATALVDSWKIDARNYWTHAYTGLPATTPINDHVRYIRNRTIIGNSYHHAGLCNVSGPVGAEVCDSDEWNTADYTAIRPASWNLGTRVTDGGGPATFEIDPNHHVHPDYRGKWFLDWTQYRGPDSAQFMSHTIPLGTLGLTKWHRIFFGSDNPPECQRLGNPCPVGTRPAWRDVVVMPFRASE